MKNRWKVSFVALVGVAVATGMGCSSTPEGEVGATRAASHDSEERDGHDHTLDGDGDGSPDCSDNCPEVYNPDQEDTDGNGIGDACEGFEGGDDDDDDDDDDDGGSVDRRRMTGGGSVFTSNDLRVTHGFQLRCNADDFRQNLQVNWQGHRFHLTDLTSATCTDTALTEAPPDAGFDTFDGTGTGRYDGDDGATIVFTFTDDGEPGVLDDAEIVVRDAGGNVVLEVDGTLNHGNHQAHAN